MVVLKIVEFVPAVISLPGGVEAVFSSPLTD